MTATRTKSALDAPVPQSGVCLNCSTGLDRYFATIHGPTDGVSTPGDYCHRCMGLLLRGWFGDRAAFLRQNRETSNGAGWRFLRASEVAELVTRSGSHFFEPDTLRWFGGKVHDCYGGVDGAVYIVTSEQDKPRQPKRLYTVRRLDLVSCEIEEPEQGGGFQGCATLDVARRRAKRIAAGEPVDQRRGMKATTESEARP